MPAPKKKTSKFTPARKARNARKAAPRKNQPKGKPAPRKKAAAAKKRNGRSSRKSAVKDTLLKGKPARGKKNGKRRNGDESDAAIQLTEEFHGRPVRRTTEYDIAEKYQDKLADLGKLLRLDVLMGDGSYHRFEFNTNVRVMCGPNRRQLYFVGGKQGLDFDTDGKDLVELGWVNEIEYFTKKDFHNFDPVDYTHEFGDEGGAQPMLLYDALNEQLQLAGGSYRVERAGIIN